MLRRIFEDTSWQMRPCERAALEGLLAELSPGVAVEIGRASGGSLRRIAAHAGHVHSFDLAPPSETLRELPNVTFHTGDSHALLPGVLEQLALDEITVAFALVDGDHTADGVRRDLEDLLAAPALHQGIVLIHDTANPEVRHGLEAVRYDAWPKLTWVDLDWLPGYVAKDSGEAWAGLGLLVFDAVEGPRGGPALIADYAKPLPELLAGLANGDGSAAAPQHERQSQFLAELWRRIRRLA